MKYIKCSTVKCDQLLPADYKEKTVKCPKCGKEFVTYIKDYNFYESEIVSFAIVLEKKKSSKKRKNNEKNDEIVEKNEEIKTNKDKKVVYFTDYYFKKKYGYGLDL
jgi:hypothetical protein